MLTFRRAVLIGAAILALLLSLALGAWRLANSRTTQLFGELVTSVSTRDSVVALTFDDGPAAYTDSVLDVLREEGVTATFFVVGQSVSRNVDIARRIVEQGHELGNHSYSHDRMLLKPPATIRREIESTDSLIRTAGANGRIHFRPPYGKRLVGLPWYLSRTGRTTVLWAIEPDTHFRDRESMARYVFDNVQPGDIILLHVEVPSRVEERAALRLIIHGLRQRGYRFETVSELMARRNR